MSTMKSNNQAGAINVLLIPLIFVIVVLIGVAGFAFWAFGGRQDYKNNVDAKIADAVAGAQQQLSTQKDKEFAEKEKYPYDTYKGPSAYGSLVVKYPKTWSGYVATQNGVNPINGYFYPGQVPTVTDSNNSYALRVAVLQTSYDDVLRQLNLYVKQGKAKSQTFRPKNVADVVGLRLDGQISVRKQGSMVVLPYREKTLELWTESTAFRKDFDNIILPNFSFSP